MSTTTRARLIDIGANLLDRRLHSGGLLSGKGTLLHDLDAVLRRADAANLARIIVTGTNLKESMDALALARELNASGAYSVKVHSTVGVHPTNTKELEFPDRGADSAARTRDKDEYVAALDGLIRDGITDGTVVAIGECGLDYDRLQFSPRDVQLAHFAFHLTLAERYSLPLFLHERNTGGELMAILREALPRLPPNPGVVHSFTGTTADLEVALSLGFDIGINGCSLKTAEQLENVRSVPLDRLHLETDAPWCDIRPGHASFPFVRTKWPTSAKEKHDVGIIVKGRSEPCTIIQVLEVVASAMGVADDDIAVAAANNGMRVFFNRGAERA